MVVVMPKHLFIALMILLLFMCIPKAAYAEVTADVTVNIDDLLLLEMANFTGGTPSWTTGPLIIPTLNPDYAAFEYGWTDEREFGVRVSSNAYWKVTVHGDDEHFAYDSGPDIKDREDIKLFDGSGWTEHVLTDTPWQFLPWPQGDWGPPGWYGQGSGGDQYTEALSLRVALTWGEDAPGIYTYPVIFTLSAQ